MIGFGSKGLNLFMVPQHVEMQAATARQCEEHTLLALLSHEPLLTGYYYCRRIASWENLTVTEENAS